ncbi:peptide chain release factor N(5)-glutamine methyltransferase [Halobacillus mangrovi]|uniref:Release factor glutamine methyltransferase n=1 Tax=Halobacillus mangrovi TaxID=402384 RepID=A0A1W5ZRZ5_9BACI|nr:peptide chain release factor N(5)-glutamine methyltransferase [Halobacillus mangrovi]ARI76062.1 protein-(glutamine-N5) methyltransferase, release factor-specific [Halobacillus mangrovi]
MQPTFTTIREARHWASVFLQEHNRETRVADLLLEYYLGLTFAQLLAYERDPFPEEKKKGFVCSVRNHASTGVPVQHLIGHAHFYGRDFKVNADVLIPRPETEELVVGVKDWMRTYEITSPVIADIGTGSGVIAITLALETNAKVLAADVSNEALGVAQQNAQALAAEVEFRQGSYLEPFYDQQIDVLVSNPPYIAYKDKKEMDDTVLNFDPELALFAEEEGLAAYKAILNQLQEQPSLIAFEIGYNQGEAVKRLIEVRFPEAAVEVRQDINKKDRMVFATHQRFL